MVGEEVDQVKSNVSTLIVYLQLKSYLWVYLQRINWISLWSSFASYSPAPRLWERLTIVILFLRMFPTLKVKILIIKTAFLHNLLGAAECKNGLPQFESQSRLWRMKSSPKLAKDNNWLDLKQFSLQLKDCLMESSMLLAGGDWIPITATRVVLGFQILLCHLTSSNIWV